MPENSPPTDSAHVKLRWWPLIVVFMLGAAWLLWVWQRPAVHRQEQVIKTYAAIAICCGLFLIWLLGFSRLRWKARLGALLAIASCFALAAALFRPAGVTGDLVPIFAWRWERSSAVPPSATDKIPQLPDGFVGYPQYLGPTRDAIVAGPKLARDWKTQPPKLLWRIPVGEGYSGFAIAEKRVFSLEQKGANEVAICRDLFTGAILWLHEYPARFENSLGGIGPRTTPTVAGDRVFTMGATGVLCALDLSSGKLLWQRNTIADAGTKPPEWGLAGSPLVAHDLVVVHPGGAGHSLAAYHVESGQPAWAGGDARAGYSSPQLVTLQGEAQWLIFNHEGLAAHAFSDGKVLWTYPWTRAAQHVSDPRIIGSNRLVVSSGYGAGADLVEVSRDSEGAWRTTRLWHSRRLKSKFGSMVVRDGFLYGLDDGRLTCLDLATGEPRWKGERVGHGQILLAGDLLLVTAENGEVLLVEATPENANELGRFAALEGKMWNPPALAPPFLIVRTENEAACYQLPLANPAR